MRLPPRSAAFAVVVAAIATTAVPTSAPAATPCAGADAAITAAGSAAARTAILCLVNRERRVRGLPTVRISGRLNASAEAHSRDMVARGYFDHVDPDGRWPGDRAAAAGYRWALVEENIANGQRTPRTVMAMWMASPGHCRNILDPGVVDMGVGVADAPGSGTIAWTQDFGRSRSAHIASSNRRPQRNCPYQTLSDGQPVVLAAAARRSVVTATAKVHAGTVVVRGTVAPGHGGTRVTVSVLRDGRRTVRVVRTARGGAFGAALRVGGAGAPRTTVKVAGVPAVQL